DEVPRLQNGARSTGLVCGLDQAPLTGRRCVAWRFHRQANGWLRWTGRAAGGSPGDEVPRLQNGAR
ncbi:hypothetical protein, partial [Candidatus Amarolinea aalborgensis]|uniref:hypothetical protein n=1 Tax=Candidatus Amarolinea aalborgensis TaxID=2249329 RepID=UPI003BF9B5F0